MLQKLFVSVTLWLDMKNLNAPPSAMTTWEFQKKSTYTLKGQWDWGEKKRHNKGFCSFKTQSGEADLDWKLQHF